MEFVAVAEEIRERSWFGREAADCAEVPVRHGDHGRLRVGMLAASAGPVNA